MGAKGKIASALFGGGVRAAGREVARETGRQATEWGFNKMQSLLFPRGELSSQLFDAIEKRNDKSAFAYLRNKFRDDDDYGTDVGSASVDNYHESHEKLNSDDEFLDALYDKVQDLDNKMGKLLAVFRAGEEREKKAELRRKQNALSRKHEIGGEGGNAPSSQKSAGGSGSTSGMGGASDEGSAPGGSGPGTPSGDDSPGGGLFADVAGTVAGEGGWAGAKKLFERIKSGKGGPKDIAKLKNIRNASRLKNIAAGAGKMGRFGLAAGVLSAVPDLIDAYDAKDSAREELNSMNVGSHMGLDTQALMETMGVSEGMVNALADSKQAQALTSAASKMAFSIAGSVLGGAIGSLIPGPGTVLGGIVGGMLGEMLGDRLAGGAVGEWVGNKAMGKMFDRLGIDETDMRLAKLWISSNDQGATEQEILYGKNPDYPHMTEDEYRARIPKMQTALEAMTWGHEADPRTWRVNWSTGIPDDEADPADYDLQSTNRPLWSSALHKASQDVMRLMFEDGYAKDSGSSLENQISVGWGLGINADPEKRGLIKKKNWAKYGMEYFGKRDTEHYDINTLDPYALGLAVNLSRNPRTNDAFWKHYGFRRLKGDWIPNRYFYNPDSAYTRSFFKLGLYHGKDGVAVVPPGTEPEFLARGGLLNGTTSLGLTSGSNVKSLENSRREIVDVVKTGIDDLDDGGWFDEAFMSFMMDSVLPGMVGALKGEKGTEPGQHVPVNVFG